MLLHNLLLITLYCVPEVDGVYGQNLRSALDLGKTLDCSLSVCVSGMNNINSLNGLHLSSTKTGSYLTRDVTEHFFFGLTQPGICY